MYFKKKIKDHISFLIYQQYGDCLQGVNINIRKSALTNFDYQTDLMFALTKKINVSAEEVITLLNNSNNWFDAQLSGPGFINIRLHDDYIREKINTFECSSPIVAKKDDITSTEKIVIDYCSANLAKEMHVGHLRSTLIGDALARVFAYCGYDVVRQNHLGDWGNQFGFLIEYITEYQVQVPQLQINDLNVIYQEAKRLFEIDSDFAIRSRARLYLLQSGNVYTNKIWQQLYNITKQHLQEIFAELKVLLTDEDIRGESFYNDMLPDIIKESEALGVCTTDCEAKVIFLDGFINPDKTPTPMIIQKSDQTFLYATTDLAALKYRIQYLGADRIIYVTDARQKQHFAMLFAAAEKMLWAENIKEKLKHVAFGTVLNEDRKPFKTRSGNTISLKSLLTEAKARALNILQEKGNLEEEEEIQHAAQVIGIGSLKYFDLRNDFIKDYTFNWDQMLAFEGNTAAYIQNAYVRIQSIFRRAKFNINDKYGFDIKIHTSTERKMAILVLEFYDIVDAVRQTLKPHVLCSYLYELASSFHDFYEKCRILGADEDVIMLSRLLLIHKVAITIKQGLQLLGIDVLEKM